ncbi:ABC transporter ATP-binding protein [Agromyces indicus]|uniref:ABC transporter ATP-binding protein n=1 Tax=Agromyces indicus TaxID=758919 RepID=A0ABU1FLQ8_9MICO|nr:ABC transporter ATP-binding protein [Agromyces indicus]MDR5692663.1 ABC transporter ATP-binding protein [Agromyces indicus]
MTAGERMPRAGALHVDLRLRDVRAAFEVALGEPDVTVLFGPSGAGKTTVIRAIAGLDRIEGGEIRADDVVWDDGGRRVVPARLRRVGVLFQDRALFPHLDVAANVAYGLQRMPRAERDRRIAEVLAACAVPGFGRRSVRELSGGEAQRVALARALAPNPRLLLLDEPFTGLDQPTRVRLRTELRELVGTTGVPAVVVTHDRDEAIALGDRLVVLIDGRVRQVDSPAVVFDRPADTRVAAAVGMDTIAPARLGGPAGTVDVGGIRLVAEVDATDLPREVAVCLRAADLGIAAPGSRRPDDATNVVPARVRAVEESAELLRVRLDAGFHLDCLLTRHDARRLPLLPGAAVDAVIPSAAVHLARIAEPA